MHVVAIIVFRAVGTWQWHIVKAKCDCCVWRTSWCAGVMWTVQAIDRRRVAEGSDCSVAREKCYAVVAKWKLDGLRNCRRLLPGVYECTERNKRPKSPSWWAPVETVLQRPLCTRCLAKGHDGRLGRGCWAHARDDQSDQALSEHRWVGRDR